LVEGKEAQIFRYISFRRNGTGSKLCAKQSIAIQKEKEKENEIKL